MRGAILIDLHKSRNNKLPGTVLADLCFCVCACVLCAIGKHNRLDGKMMQHGMILVMIVLLMMVQLSSWFANGQHARATINDFVAKATKKIDKTLVKKKLEENAKKAQKRK